MLQSRMHSTGMILGQEMIRVLTSFPCMYIEKLIGMASYRIGSIIGNETRRNQRLFCRDIRHNDTVNANYFPIYGLISLDIPTFDH